MFFSLFFGKNKTGLSFKRQPFFEIIFPIFVVFVQFSFSFYPHPRMMTKQFSFQRTAQDHNFYSRPRMRAKKDCVPRTDYPINFYSRPRMRAKEPYI